jgi:hypothetical protein
MKIVYKILLVCTLAAILAGCAASVAYLNDGLPKYPETNADSVKVYSERTLERKTIEIGYVSVHITDNPNGDLMKKILKKRAAEIGADAIVNFQIMGPLAEGIAVKFK